MKAMVGDEALEQFTLGADMSFEEKQSWVQAVVLLIVPGWYFVNVLGQGRDTPVSEIEYQQLLLWNVGIVIMATIAAMIMVMILALIAANVRAAVAVEIAAQAGSDVKDAVVSDVDMKNIDRRDERDVSIDRFGGYVGGFVIGVGALVSLGLAMLESEPFWIANALYAGLVLSGLVASTVKIVAYRRGI